MHAANESRIIVGTIVFVDCKIWTRVCTAKSYYRRHLACRWHRCTGLVTGISRGRRTTEKAVTPAVRLGTFVPFTWNIRVGYHTAHHWRAVDGAPCVFIVILGTSKMRPPRLNRGGQRCTGEKLPTGSPLWLACRGCADISLIVQHPER